MIFQEILRLDNDDGVKSRCSFRLVFSFPPLRLLLWTGVDWAQSKQQNGQRTNDELYQSKRTFPRQLFSSRPTISFKWCRVTSRVVKVASGRCHDGFLARSQATFVGKLLVTTFVRLISTYLLNVSEEFEHFVQLCTRRTWKTAARTRTVVNAIILMYVGNSRSWWSLSRLAREWNEVGNQPR